MRQMISSLCYFTMTMVCLPPLIAVEDQEAVLVRPIECTKDELMTFFPQPIVKAILLKDHVSEQQADSIAKELSQKDQELVRMVEEKASKLNPDPFKDLSQRDLAIKIYRETLYEVFAKVLKSHGIIDEDQIQALLDEMNKTKSKLFIECIRKEHVGYPVTTPETPAPNSSSTPAPSIPAPSS